jgi:hypothetical protein
MKIKCIATLRKDLYQNTQNVLVTQDFELPVGKTFTVYSISIWETVLHYLIADVNEPRPDWYPAELFVVQDTMMPKEMHYKYFGLEDKRGVNALWGYKEMVLDDQHYIDLIERESNAIEVFFKRKKEIDES